ncbi:LPS export ABC transporter periplasmic protein LptC [soil metagenome]
MTAKHPTEATPDPLAAWRRSSARVFWMRRWLPRAMIGLGVFTFLWMLVRAVVALVVAADFHTGEIHMTNPKFMGRDTKGRAYNVTAADAVRDTRHPDRVRLNSVVIHLQGDGPNPMSVVAKSGDLDQTRHVLHLAGDVDADNGSGNRFRSDRAVIDTESGAVRGDSAVVGEGPLGRITASSYSISENGQRILFSGGVRSHLNMHTEAASSGASTPRR